jgi:hypothetical protein
MICFSFTAAKRRRNGQRMASMTVHGSVASWPRSLLALPLAAVLFGLQAVPVFGFFMGLARA